MLWDSAVAQDGGSGYDYDLAGLLEDAGAGNGIFPSTILQFACDQIGFGEVTRNAMDGEWEIDVFGDASLIIASTSAGLGCPPAGPSKKPSLQAGSSKWYVKVNTTGITRHEVFAFVCCDGAAVASNASDDLFVDGISGNILLDALAFPDDGVSPIWDGHVHQYPAGAPGSPGTVWAARWTANMDGTYRSDTVRVLMSDATYTTLTPLLGVLNASLGTGTGWAFYFAEFGTPGSSGTMFWWKPCGSTPYGTEQFSLATALAGFWIKAIPVASVSDGSLP